MKKGFVFIETIIVLMIVTLSLTLLFASYTLIRTKSQEKESYDKISDKYLLYAISNLGTNASNNYGIIADYGNLVLEPKNCDKYDKIIYGIKEKTVSGKKQYTLEQKNCQNYVFDKCTDTYINGLEAANRQAQIDNCNMCSYYNIFSPKAVKKVEINTSSFTKVDSSMPNCQKVFTELNLVKLYVIQDVTATLQSTNATKIYDNGTINYLKTLKRCYDDGYASENGLVKDEQEKGVCNDPVRYLVGVFSRYNEYFFASIEI